MYTQITLKNGVHIQIGIANDAEYEKLKDKIKRKKRGFLELVDSCEVRVEEIVLIEKMKEAV